MSTVRYLVDNNVLSRIGAGRRASNFFRNSCRLSGEVLHEASGFPDIEALQELDYPIDVDVLGRVREIMSTVRPGDTALVDLYRNLGNADPILIASALQAMDVSAETLFPEEWRIVTDDAAVRAKAAEFGVRTLGHDEFVRLLPPDAAT